MLGFVSVLVGFGLSNGQTNGAFNQTLYSSPNSQYNERAQVFISVGDNSIQLGNLESALIAYDEAVAINQGSAEAYMKRAITLQYLGRSEEAAADYSKAIQLNPFAADLYTLRPSKRILNTLVFNPQHNNDLSEEEPSMIHFERSIKLLTEGDLAGALTQIDRAIQLSKNENSSYFKLRGNIHVAFGNYRDAIDDYNRALLIDPYFTAVYHNRGIAKILSYNRSDGCADLYYSASEGVEKSSRKVKYLCIN